MKATTRARGGREPQGGRRPAASRNAPTSRRQPARPTDGRPDARARTTSGRDAEPRSATREQSASAAHRRRPGTRGGRGTSEPPTAARAAQASKSPPSGSEEAALCFFGRCLQLTLTARESRRTDESHAGQLRKMACFASVDGIRCWMSGVEAASRGEPPGSTQTSGLELRNNTHFARRKPAVRPAEWPLQWRRLLRWNLMLSGCMRRAMGVRALSLCCRLLHPTPAGDGK